MDNRDTKGSSKPVSQAGYDLARLDYAKLIKERKLSRVQRYVTGGGTELPFTGRTSNGFSYKNKRRGVYHCAVCELPAYSSKHKFDSGTGWPSFFKAIDPDHIWETTDVSLGMVRKEVLCARCHAHQGHVFRDGPQPTGLRYCINTASLTFKPAKGGNQDPPHSTIGRFFRSLSRLITPNKEDEEPASPPQTDITSTETDEKKLQGDH